MPKHDKTAADANVISLQLTTDNVVALIVLGGFCFLGCVYVCNAITRRRKCSCKLCKGNYQPLYQLGSGAYGTVWLVERVDETAAVESKKKSKSKTADELFVVKKVVVHDITEGESYASEAKRLNSLRHKHVVAYEDDFLHRETKWLGHSVFFMLVMEFCQEGDLKSLVDRSFQRLSEWKIRELFQQLLQAVCYIHERNIIHRDIKMQNVFVSADGNVRLGDFGLCRVHRRATKCSETTNLSQAGTDCYMAPEMLTDSSYGKPADMWCLGCVLLELCTGEYLWEYDTVLAVEVRESGSQVVQDLINQKFHASLGPHLRSFVRRLLLADPKRRPTASELLKKKFFKRNFPVEIKTFEQYNRQNTSASAHKRRR